MWRHGDKEGGAGEIWRRVENQNWANREGARLWVGVGNALGGVPE